MPGWPRALARALIITGTPTVLWLLGWSAAHAWSSGSSAEQLVTAIGLISLPTRLAMFVTARKRNGYAGIHDLITSTRVVLKSAYQPRPALPATAEAPPQIKTLPLVGPYHVLEPLGHENGAELLLGFDARLLRRVWIRKQPPGAAPTPQSLRQLSRPGRLRWLTARRTDTEAWDAYEAASGQPLVGLLSQPQEWGKVRYWLLDLAQELLAATRDGTLPDKLSLERVWIAAGGHAKLLDFTPPEGDNLRANPSPRSEASVSTPQQFLELVAAASLQERSGDSASTGFAPSVPLPLHASRFLDTLKRDADLSQCVASLRALLPLPARISRGRRALQLAGALAFPIVAAGLAWGLTTFKRNILLAAPELATLNECLTHYDQLKRAAKSQLPAHSEELAAFETYIAARFAPLVTNTAQWNNPVTRAVIPAPLRDEAEQILTRSGSPGAMDLATASARLEQFFGKPPELAAREALQNPNFFLGALAVGYGVTVLFVIIPCLVGSLLFRGGAIASLLGIVFVNRNGLPASRWRVTARNLVAWLPFVLIPVTMKIQELLPLLAALAVVVSTAISLLLPTRGLQDRLAGTWPVPR